MQTTKDIKKYWDCFIKEHNTSKIMVTEKGMEVTVKGNFQLFKELVLDKAKGKVSVLEVGCGSGIFTEMIRKHKNVGKLVCTDLSSEGIKICKKKRLNGVVANLEKLPFKDKSFDVICGFEVLHHVNNPQKAISEACRVAKKTIFFHEPNSWNFMRKLMERFYYDKRAHETSYSMPQFRKWFKNKPFKLKIIPYSFFMPYFSNDTLVRWNLAVDDALNKTPLKIIGASLILLAERKSDS